MLFLAPSDVLENAANSFSIEQVHEHFSLKVDSGPAFCEARRVTSTETVRRRLFFPMKIREYVRLTHSPDGAVALDIRGGKMFRTNLVGSRIVELLQIGLSESAIVEKLAAEFSVERSRVASDIQEFLEHLLQHHLLYGQEAESRMGR